ncbi:MAG: hypothetical protein GTO18_14905 [Anaerolineales bacterium]|nr:hypothetical protein [Anaerolineales bacterium]
MIESVDEYLVLLRKELGTSDPATIQDALADAEEYLRTALEKELEPNAGISEADALQQIVEKYGTPEEIASAYKEIETLTRPVLAQPVDVEKRPLIQRFFFVISDSRAWGALLYMFFSIVAGMIYFTWAITGLSLSLSMMILIIGIPLFIFFLLSVRTIALVEGRIIEALLGVRMPRRPIFTQRGVGWGGQLKALFIERRTWGAIVYMLLQLPLGIVYFTIFIVTIAFSLGLILSPVTELVFHDPLFTFGGTDYYTPVWLLPLVVFVGVILLLATMHLAKFIGQMHGVLAKSLLVGV